MQAFTAKPTVDDVDELEILLTAQRLSSFASSATSGSAGSLREAIAEFRAALNPQSHVTASPALFHAEGTETPAKARELDLEAPIHCVCLDKANLVSEIAQHIEAVHAKSECEIHRLVDIIMGLKTELRDLRAAVEAPKLDPRSQDHGISPTPTKVSQFLSTSSLNTTPGRDATDPRAPSPLVNRVQGHRSPIQYSPSRASSIFMSPVPIRIPPEPSTPRWIEKGMQDSFTPEPVRLGSPPTPRRHSPVPDRGWVAVSPTPPRPMQCYPASPVQIDPLSPLAAAISPSRCLPDSRTPQITPQRTPQRVPPPLDQERDQPSTSTCQTVKKSSVKKKGAKKKATVKPKPAMEECANDIIRENESLEPREIDPTRSVSSIPGIACPPLQRIYPTLRPASPPSQPAGPIAQLPTSCFPTPKSPIRSAVPIRPPIQSRPPGSALSPGLIPDLDPAKPIHVPMQCSALTPTSPAIPSPLPYPSVPRTSNGSLPSNVRQVATALSSFLAGQDDELAFERGDTILVLDTPAHPTGWLLGQNSSGRRGLFPARYVKLAT
ncbi:hypothetical protein FRC01_004593 [Tulasnella sp. 417]|nr:hypothetical protein FRC01_004593 [Tulasnella sp. 417]